jgi:uncharacterized protein (DUF885 family)
MRGLTAASLDIPGPFEEQAKEAFFNVTLPAKSWSQRQADAYLERYSYPVINTTAIREVFPGRFEQYLWNQHQRLRIRKLLSANLGTRFAGSNVGGWAHYTEQMMLDEGIGRTPGVVEEKDTPFLKLRLGQLQDALLRNARYVVALEMHTHNMSVTQAREFFVREGYQTRPTARQEALRGTSDPTYLVDTLGKLEILKLQDDYRRRVGAKFSLRDFHDRFLEQGIAPISVIRRALLGDNSPAL